MFMRLADDPKLSKEFADNPMAVMERAGIKKDIAKIIATRDVHAIRQMLEKLCGKDSKIPHIAP